MAKESNHNADLRKILVEEGFEVHRIESHSTDPGIPDIYIFKYPIHCWIETKADLKRPNRVHYQPKQALWLESHSRKKGLCFTIQFITSSKNFIFIPGNESYKAEESLAGYLEYDIAVLPAFLNAPFFNKLIFYNPHSLKG